MARPIRSRAPNTWHHVMSRGADRQDIFTDDQDRLHFEHLLGDSSDEYGVDVNAYCLMGNHFHVLVHCRDGRLSEAMQHICGRHARRYNVRHGRSGPVFGDRFKSVPVASDEQVIVTARYIHRNPLDIVPVRALGAYRWSSLGPYLGMRQPPAWLSTGTLQALMRTRDHRRFVEDPLPSDLTPPQGFDWSPPSIDDIESAVARETACPVERIRRARRGSPNPARTLVLTLAIEFRSATAESLANRYELGSPAAVRTAARRGRIQRNDDPAFERLHGRIVRQLMRWGLTPT
jgi:REP element-mobilizing transposase RayT